MGMIGTMMRFGLAVVFWLTLLTSWFGSSLAILLLVGRICPTERFDLLRVVLFVRRLHFSSVSNS